MLLTACSARQTTATVPASPLRPALPPDEYAAPVQARREAAAGSSLRLGDGAAERGPGAFLNHESQTIWLPALSAGGASAR
jgi:hypothetical protein